MRSSSSHAHQWMVLPNILVFVLLALTKTAIGDPFPPATLDSGPNLPTAPIQPCTTDGSCAGVLRLSSFGGNGGATDMIYVGSHDLSPSNVYHNVTTVVLTFHGAACDAYNYYSILVDVAQNTTGVDLNTHAFFVPLFPVKSTTQAYTWGVPQGGLNLAVFSASTKWSTGDVADNNNAMTSFDMVDAFLATIAQAFPSAKIVLASHSAGAQLVHRYSLFTDPQTFSKYQVILANSGTYTYQSNHRLTQAALLSCQDQSCLGTLNASSFEPYSNSACSDANSFPYGLDNLSGPYVTSHLGNAHQGPSLRCLKQTMLLGSKDTLRTTANPPLDMTCGADAEGYVRIERGLAYAAYFDYIVGCNTMDVHIVDGCYHDAWCMLSSPIAKSLTFGVPLA
ncbi:uncharacterized protein BJ171DRAFT_476365 [Polychytrium aggregatum]|uniref:uncharacterized protein n=1 Tax=Polychytrium aggregatum TaxID=110093 RepID=UPI0022FE8932|nr:uncharacterized protein BJ171DRAFT_476365 [Polychytrium aggregatum]KAI9202884.1 hypothetical protein BJ171DRAFT_476365 [Polychytrium aggregatum]